MEPENNYEGSILFFNFFDFVAQSRLYRSVHICTHLYTSCQCYLWVSPSGEWFTVIEGNISPTSSYYLLLTKKESSTSMTSLVLWDVNPFPSVCSAWLRSGRRRKKTKRDVGGRGEEGVLLKPKWVSLWPIFSSSLKREQKVSVTSGPGDEALPPGSCHHRRSKYRSAEAEKSSHNLARPDRTLLSSLWLYSQRCSDLQPVAPSDFKVPSLSAVELNTLICCCDDLVAVTWGLKKPGFAAGVGLIPGVDWSGLGDAVHFSVQ